MKKKICLFAAIFTCMLFSGGCSDYLEWLAGSGATQVDMTVVIPIHPSSLEYFDYILNYYDNEGKQYTDTVRNAGDGTSPENCYVRTFSYDHILVTCTMNVRMVPKEIYTSMGEFLFYIPKPSIIPVLHGSAAKFEKGSIHHDIEKMEAIQINPMSIEEFESTYGLTFSSHCGLYDGPDGYDILFN